MSRILSSLFQYAPKTLQQTCSSQAIPRRMVSSFDYLKRSKIPTYHFQKSLPRLPIPKLEDTCQRYLLSQKALLDETQYKSTEAAVKSFQEKEGPDLHDELVKQDKRNKHTSYISGIWFDMYLKDRRATVLNHNPFMTLVYDPRPEYNKQLLRTTNIIVSSLRLMKTLEEKVLEPDIFHLNPKKSDTETFRKIVRWLPEAVSWYGAYMFNAYPLDMSQYKSLFKSTRIPRPDKDELVSSPDSRHLLVMRNGHFYTFDVLNENGSIKPANEILAHLKYISEDSRPPAEYPVGALSTETRDTWANIRPHLLACGNEETLKMVDSAVFVISLESQSPPTTIEMIETFLHGDGANRWFDKSFNLIIPPDGRSSLNFEHSWGDGIAMLRYANEMIKDSKERPAIHPDTQASTSVDSSKCVQHLNFNLDSKMKEAIIKAQARFDEATKALDKDFLSYKRFNKSYVKGKKLSPDSVMQLVIQMAYYKITSGGRAATYESCSTAAFKHGRTETVRSCTWATRKACDTIFSSSASVEEMFATLQECSKVHSQLTKEAAMGQGFDRHLLALYKIAEQKSGKLPSLFADPHYKLINHIILSTSTLSSADYEFGGFAPVVPNGFGIGYVIEDDRLGYNITAYKDQQNCSDMIAALKESLNNIHDILEGKKPSEL
ncbi:CPT2 [Acanthosepion pharaonis]|uniref:CPT2 n=1 Tax=Acanthosepion pharaonis TaxID=158019 RepID=A0A812C4F6_ACAPH|nr:CPT2 [Sepia pharaonis]